MTVLVGHFAGEKGVIVGMIACDKSDYADPYYEIEMECDVPEEFRVRKTIIGQSRVIGGVERRHLKVIGNRAPKQPSMEIKQGDKVRVSEDAPRVYLSSVNNLFRYHECKVEEVDGDSAIIRHTDIGIDRWLAIPIKYLIKVDAEAKEVKLKVGDWVKIGETPNPRLNGRVGTISQIDKEGYEISFNDGFFTVVSEEDLTLADEPTEQTETKHTKTKGDTLTFPIAFDLTDSYWDAYAADLAREIAVKSMEKSYGCDPERIADYAVSVAKAVVEGLKRE